MEDVKHAKLSKSILDMKFMKRTKERVQKEQEDAEGKAMYSNEITEQMRKSGNIVFTETSIYNCLNLMEGRLSFGGMNPEVEKLMQNDYGMKVKEVEKCKETDINDEEMAQGYSSVVNTMANKFNNKRNNNKNNNSKNTRRKFQKPADD